MPKIPQQVCRRCSLRSETLCRHTKAGRAVLAKTGSTDSTPPSSPSSSGLSVGLPSPLTSNTLGVCSPTSADAALPIASTINSLDLGSSSDSPSTPSADSSDLSHGSTLLDVDDADIDPFLLALSGSTSSTSNLASPSTTSSPTSMPNNTPFSTPTRPRTSKSIEGQFGYVEGCTRGRQTYVIPRIKPLRPVQTDASKASKRWLRELQIILARCERMSIETNCWLLLSAQHANANNPPIHYASPKIRAEALEQTRDLSSQFVKVTNALIASRRTDAIALAQQLRDAEATITAAVGESDAVRLELSRERAHVNAMEELLSKLGVDVPSRTQTDEVEVQEGD